MELKAVHSTAIREEEGEETRQVYAETQRLREQDLNTKREGHLKGIIKMPYKYPNCVALKIATIKGGT